MFIAADIGNSSAKLGFFFENQLLVQRIATHPSLPDRYLSEIISFTKEHNIGGIPYGIIISTVVPGYDLVVADALEEIYGIKAVILDLRMNTGLEFKIPDPGQLGADRIANCVAGYEMCRAAVAAVDLGTATTISVVTADREYIGGAIFPGLSLMGESLAERTAKLPRVPVLLPRSALGNNTIESLQSGLTYGTAGAIERLLSEIEAATKLRLKVIVTGGYGRLVSPLLKRRHRLKENLTLIGLKIIYHRNTNA